MLFVDILESDAFVIFRPPIFRNCTGFRCAAARPGGEEHCTCIVKPGGSRPARGCRTLTGASLGMRTHAVDDFFFGVFSSPSKSLSLAVVLCNHLLKLLFFILWRSFIYISAI